MAATQQSQLAGAEPSKGLRQFSRQVWTKVMEKKKTTYNEVADELVEEFRIERAATAEKVASMGVSAALFDEASNTKESNPALEERNVRRRVYDALNVLMALGIIVKDRKMITWKGLPSNNAEEIANLEKDFEMRRRSLVEKRRMVRDLILQQLAFRRLVQRNKMQEQENRKLGFHTEHSTDMENGDGGDVEAEFPPVPGRPRNVIHLPLITLSTPDTATIQLEIIAPQRQEATLVFDAPFQVHDDKELLRQMRLHEFPENHLRKLLPAHLQRYLFQPIEEPALVRDTAPAAPPVAAGSRQSQLSAPAGQQGSSGGGAGGAGGRGKGAQGSNEQVGEGAGLGGTRTAGVSGQSSTSTGQTVHGADGTVSSVQQPSFSPPLPSDKLSEAMRNAASAAQSSLTAHASQGFLPGVGVHVGPPELAPILLGPSVTRDRLYLPPTAAVDVATRLMGSMGLSTPPPAWREQHRSAVTRGAVPVLGMSSGWDKGALLTILSIALRSLQGLLNDRGGFASSERVSTAVQAACMSITREAAPQTMQTMAAHQTPREVQTWVTRLLEAVGGYLIQHPSVKDILQEHMAGRQTKRKMQEQQAQELVLTTKMKLQTMASSDMQSQQLTLEFRMAATSFNTIAQEEWNLLLSRQKSALALVEAELVGQSVTLLAAGWLPEPTTMVTAQQQHAAATTLSMNINLTAMRQCVQQGIPLAANGQLPPSGPGPVLVPIASLLPSLGLALGGSAGIAGAGGMGAPGLAPAVAGTTQTAQGKATAAPSTGTAPVAATKAAALAPTAPAAAAQGAVAGTGKPGQADLLRIMQQLLASGGGKGGAAAPASGTSTGTSSGGTGGTASGAAPGAAATTPTSAAGSTSQGTQAVAPVTAPAPAAAT